MTHQQIPVDEYVTDMLRDQKATRVAVFLRTKSPLYPIPTNDVLATACFTLAADPIESRAKLMTVWK
ncbi:unnamed protein product [Clonostachys rosea f. rosea IK726]|uniref:Uncharacterized protein n=1 Tax=Clonostachys rosea f. rosea IK726 TaxID=1349383 RepID=A0ACA9UAF5_BIOOC|nr:unnamed protein product [Clonostachys rosea f. rosea IK726]